MVNLFCEAVSVADPLGRLVLQRLDGTRTIGELKVELAAVLDALRPESDEVQRQITEAREHLDDALENKLQAICELGLLEA